MRHHLRRAKHVYNTRGLKEMITTAVQYLPIEINNLVFRARYGSGTRVMEEDWDNLILLDACRYDMFADRVDLDGDLQSRISLGSTSEEFLERNFGDGTFHDTVYVNTNPYVPRLGLDDGTFHAVIDLLEEWDPEFQTVHPETVVEAARDAHAEFPNKRLVVHFMQPHVPFIGEIGKQIPAKGWGSDQVDGELTGKTVWQQLRDGSYDDEDLVWKAYYENLDIVISYVDDLLDELSGKTVISADHGNLVGERLYPIVSRGKYGHYYGIYTPELVKVPWFVINADSRREIRSNLPVKNQTASEEVVEDRLQALGYH